jgi:hypothetical protein
LGRVDEGIGLGIDSNRLAVSARSHYSGDRAGHGIDLGNTAQGIRVDRAIRVVC